GQQDQAAGGEATARRGSVNLKQQTLKIRAFGERERDGVAVGWAEVPDDLGLPAAVGQCSKNHLQEQVGADGPGAGKGHQVAAGTDKPEAVQVEVFVTPRCTFDLLLVVGELGRVADDDIELIAPCHCLPEILKGVSLDEFSFVWRTLVELVRLLSQRQGLSGRIDIGHMAPDRQPEPAGITEQIQNARNRRMVLMAACQAGKDSMIINLVEVIAGFVTFPNI